jgi:hypothetical protein
LKGEVHLEFLELQEVHLEVLVVLYLPFRGLQVIPFQHILAYQPLVVVTLQVVEAYHEHVDTLDLQQIEFHSETCELLLGQPLDCALVEVLLLEGEFLGCRQILFVLAEEKEVQNRQELNDSLFWRQAVYY